MNCRHRSVKPVNIWIFNWKVILSSHFYHLTPSPLHTSDYIYIFYRFLSEQENGHFRSADYLPIPIYSLLRAVVCGTDYRGDLSLSYTGWVPLKMTHTHSRTHKQAFLSSQFEICFWQCHSLCPLEPHYVCFVHDLMDLLERKTYATSCILHIVVHEFFSPTPQARPSTFYHHLNHLPYIHYVQIFIQFVRNIWQLTYVEETEKRKEQWHKMFSTSTLKNKSLPV